VEEVFALLVGGPRLIRDCIPLHDASAARHGADGAELIERRRLRWVILQVPMGGAYRLPDAAEIRLAVGRTRNLR
jgi:hypothetical protein